MDARRIAGGVLIAAGLLAFAAGCALFRTTEAAIEVSAVAGVVPLMIEFDGSRSSGSGGIVTYHWSFGTDDESFEASGTYTYRHAGTYELTLTVRDAGGDTDTTKMEIEVAPAVWVSDENLQRIYKLDMSGNVLQSFDLPVTHPRGITIADVGGSDWVFVACQGDGNQRILKVDPLTGEVSAEYSAPAQDPLQLTYGAQSPKRLWHLDGLSRKIYALNPSNGQVLGSFGTNYFRASQQVGNEPFLQSPEGLDWTEETGSSGFLWYLEAETQLLYQIDIIPAYDLLSGVQLEIVGDPVAIDPSVFPIAAIDWYDGFLWAADRDHHELVQIDPQTGQRTGEVISGFPGANVSGLEIQQ